MNVELIVVGKTDSAEVYNFTVALCRSSTTRLTL